ncbi:MAG: 50S ribosomal protein L25 [Candidatus Latescibacterota bacterium]
MPEVALRLHPREQISVRIHARPERGKGQISRLRREQGCVPGVLYGHRQEPFPFKTDARALERIFGRAGQSVLFTVEFDGEDLRSEQAIVREVQHHKVRGHVLHLDLLRIDPHEERVVSVPLHTTGVPEGVRIGGGALQQTVSALELRCIVVDMPARVEIDVSPLHIGESVHVSDLLGQEPRIATDPSVAVVSVLAPRLVIEEELEVAAEAEEGAAAAAAGEGAESPEGAQE